MSKEKLTITQYAQLMGVTRQCVYNWGARGEIKIKRDKRGPYIEIESDETNTAD